jgi:hypothetical protein
MQDYEYKVIPAPQRAEKSRAAKTGAERFALTLTTLINQMARDGWEYVRADTLPCDERTGLTGRSTVFHNLLVFRREKEQVAQPVPAQIIVSALPQAPAPRLVALHEEGSPPRLGPATPEA